MRVSISVEQPLIFGASVAEIERMQQRENKPIRAASFRPRRHGPVKQKISLEPILDERIRWSPEIQNEINKYKTELEGFIRYDMQKFGFRQRLISKDLLVKMIHRKN
jgi:hypothetical protein